MAAQEPPAPLRADGRLAKALKVELDARQANYLGNVMRLGVGAELLVFDGQSGEWLARISASREEADDPHRRAANPRAPKIFPDVWLAFAPVKRAQTDWLVEKATELGAARLLPVMTQRTIAERVKLERLQAIAIEAAEQCGRTRLPEIASRSRLKALLGPRRGAPAVLCRRSRRRTGSRTPSARTGRRSSSGPKAASPMTSAR